MVPTKGDIISRLQKDILSLQGFKPASLDAGTVSGLGLIKHAFPNATFPLGVVHEFFCTGVEDGSSSCGFISGILSWLMKKGGTTVWISSSQNIFPPALKSFGIDPHRIIFIHLKKEKERLWTMEEALKCDSLSSVVGEIGQISFTESRRFQLAVEKSQVTAFLLRLNPKNFTTASVTRWKIQPLPSEQEMEVPGIGFPRWDVELLKVRNGYPGKWQMEWKSGEFQFIHQPLIVNTEAERKIV